MKRVLMMSVATALVVWAGAPAAQVKTDEKAKPVTLSGCLAKGTDATSFVLNNAAPAAAAAKDAAKEAPAAGHGAHGASKSYHVMPSGSVKLDAHVGHMVELTGQVDAPKPPAPGAAPAAKADSSMPHLTVTAMKHVAPKCS
jgi:hypothetical protein